MFNQAEVFANASIDINANICRLVIDSVAILKKDSEFSEKYLNKILMFIKEAFIEIDKFIFRDKKYVINKQLFKLYWCLEALKLFVDAGLISMLTIDDTFRCFDGNRCCHAHFRCDKCGRIVDLQMKKDFLSLVEGLETYTINDAQLYLKGLCPACKNKK